MFVQITNGESANKRSPSPRRVLTPEKEENDEEVPSPKKKIETISFREEDEPDMTEDEEDDIPPKEPEKKPKKSHFDRLSDKATQFFPKKKNLGKVFGKKEPDIRIYTIDREMAKPKTEEDAFRTVELKHPLRKNRQEIQIGENSMHKTVGSLASPYPPYRLFFLPQEDWKDEESLMATILRILLCECTLACFIIVWIIIGALTFYLTEGPYEHAKLTEYKSKQLTLIVSLATDLRLLDPEKSVWKDTIEKYTFMHARIVSEGIANSYGEQKVFWNFCGSLLFATSLLTTFGLATPLPLTLAGGIEATLFTIIGVPLHFFFLKHLGRIIALKIQLISKEIENKLSDIRKRIVNVRRFGEDIKIEKEIWPDKMFMIDFKPSSWLKYFPIVSTLFYYIFGFLIFGLAREMDFPRILFFPLDFARCDSFTSSFSRIGYAWYLEGAAILTSLNLALLRDSKFSGITPSGIKYGFMTNSLD